MEEELGYRYQAFLFSFQRGYGEMSYLKSDLVSVWQRIKKQLQDNPHYLQEVKKKYKHHLAEDAIFFAELRTVNLSTASDDRLLFLLKRCVQAQTHAVGLGHVVEAIGLEIEAEFREKLSAAIPDQQNLNSYYSQLIAPSGLSFLAQEEDELRATAEMPEQDQSLALERHQEKYFWLQNSYTGAREVTIASLRRRLQELAGSPKRVEVEDVKEELIAQLSLSQELRQMVEIIEFATMWQDERKASVLQTIGHMAHLLAEVSRRVEMSEDILVYLTNQEIQAASSMEDFKKYKNTLVERVEGVYILMNIQGVATVSGKAYQELGTAEKSEDGIQQEIRGSIANRGTAVGKVVVCRDLSSISRVQEGDIVVASMTRPEYMPALKKAAAIVTDEGGITCHAAIVAREFKIPAVIGTKVATKVLKDGMMVQVRANHGVVRVLS